MNHYIHVRTNTVSEVNSRVECISRDGFSCKVRLRIRDNRREQRNREEHMFMKSGDRIKIQFQRLLHCYDGIGHEMQCGEVKVEMCGAHVIQKTPLAPQQSVVSTFNFVLFSANISIQLSRLLLNLQLSIVGIGHNIQNFKLGGSTIQDKMLRGTEAYLSGQNLKLINKPKFKNQKVTLLFAVP